MHSSKTIEAGQVKVGDRIHAGAGAHTEWVRVTSVEIVGTDVRIQTTAWFTTKHVREALAVQTN